MIAIADKGEVVAIDSINLGLAIAGFALVDLHEGKRPNAEQIDRLAGDFIDSEAWAEAEKSHAAAVLTALTKGQPVDLLPEDIADIIFAIDAWLLSAFGPMERGWTQYLDQILASLESVLSQSE